MKIRAVAVCIMVASLGLLAAPLAAEAQQPKKVPRIGYVFGTTSAEGHRRWEAARQGLRELGYVDGQNIALEVRWAEGRARVAVLTNPGNPIHGTFWSETQAAALRLGVKLQRLEVRGPEDFEGAFATASRGRAGALLAFDDPLTVGHPTQIAALAAKSRIPAVYGFREFPDAGGLSPMAPTSSTTTGALLPTWTRS